MRYKIALCDDDPAAAQLYAPQIAAAFLKHGAAASVAVFQSSARLSEAILHGRVFDALFLDVAMPELDGISLSQRLRSLAYTLPIVFLSSRSERVYDCFSVQALDFIRKAHFAEVLDGTVQRLITALEQSEQRSVTFSDSSQSYRLPVAQILYLEITGKILNIVLRERTVHLRCRMHDAEALLEPYRFIRVHKGYLVNPRAIFSIGKSDIELTDGTRLPLSRQRSVAVRTQFLQYTKQEIEEASIWER